jgi:hypothetical protein
MCRTASSPTTPVRKRSIYLIYGQTVTFIIAAALITNSLIFLDFAVLGTYGNLEWMGDLSWNLGCIMLSENNCHSLDIFSEIPFSVCPSKSASVEGKSTAVLSDQSKSTMYINSEGLF